MAIYIATIKNYGNYVQVKVKKSEFSPLLLLSLVFPYNCFERTMKIEMHFVFMEPLPPNISERRQIMTRNANFHSAIFFYFFFISLFLNTRNSMYVGVSRTFAYDHHVL